MIRQFLDRVLIDIKIRDSLRFVLIFHEPVYVHDYPIEFFTATSHDNFSLE